MKAQNGCLVQKLARFFLIKILYFLLLQNLYIWLLPVSRWGGTRAEPKTIDSNQFLFFPLSVNFGSTKIAFSFSTKANPGFPLLGFLTYFARV